MQMKFGFVVEIDQLITTITRNVFFSMQLMQQQNCTCLLIKVQPRRRHGNSLIVDSKISSLLAKHLVMSRLLLGLLLMGFGTLLVASPNPPKERLGILSKNLDNKITAITMNNINESKINCYSILIILDIKNKKNVHILLNWF